LPQDLIVLVTCRAWPELTVSDRCLADVLEVKHGVDEVSSR